MSGSWDNWQNVNKSILYNVSSNISASNGRRSMKILPLEPSHWEESNGSSFMLLRCLDAEIIDEMSTNRQFATFLLCHFDVSPNISASRHRRRMKQLPFDSSQWDGSNGSIFKFLRPLDVEIFGETSKWRSTESGKMPICWHFVNYLGIQTW